MLVSTSAPYPHIDNRYPWGMLWVLDYPLIVLTRFILTLSAMLYLLSSYIGFLGVPLKKDEMKISPEDEVFSMLLLLIYIPLTECNS